ncbi:MAG: SseB family protein [Butyribacter sp.]|nr:SseB family protein [bacterium]MDY3853539.1 SseB family protein [Butyribacter sp.]
MNHKEIEAALDELKRQKKTQLPADVLEALNKLTVVVPAVMPKGTSPEILKKMLTNPGKDRPLPEGVNPHPCIFENQEGESLLPVFTSEAELKKAKNVPNFPLLLNMDFQSCIHFVQRNPKVTGIVLNAYTHNVIMHLNPNAASGNQEKKVTIEQYHYMMRQRFESSVLPKQLFEQKEAFIQKLANEKGECLKALYDEIYDGEIACPYVEEDFEFMFLNLREDFMVCQITMPAKNLAVKMCPSAIFAWNKTQKKIWYYAIVLSGGQNQAHLFEVYENGKNADLGEAPVQGNEISTVLDLIQGANDDTAES